jgi:signal transduction histidine kinase
MRGLVLTSLLLFLSPPVHSVCPFDSDTVLDVGVVGELGYGYNVLIQDFAVRVAGVRYTALTGMVESGDTGPALPFVPSCRAGGVNVTVVPSFASGLGLTRTPVIAGLSNQVARLINQDSVVSLIGPSWTEESHFVTQMWLGPEPLTPIMTLDIVSHTAALEESVRSIFTVVADTPALRDVRAIGVIYSTALFGRAILSAAQSFARNNDEGISVVAEVALATSTPMTEVLKLAKATGLRVFVLGVGSENHRSFVSAAANASMTSDDGYTYVVPHQLSPLVAAEEYLSVEEELVNDRLFQHLGPLLDSSQPNFLVEDLRALFPEVLTNLTVGVGRCFVYDEPRALLFALNSTIEQGYDPRTDAGRSVLRHALLDLELTRRPACMSEWLEYPPVARQRVLTVTRSHTLEHVAPGDPAPYKVARMAFTPDTCAGGRLFRRPVSARSLECELCPVGTYNVPGDGKEDCVPCTGDTVLIGDACQICPPPSQARQGPDGYPLCVDQVDTSVIVIVSLLVIMVVGTGVVVVRARAFAKERAHAEELARSKAESMARFTSMLSLVSHELRTPLQLVMLHLDMMHATDPAQIKRIQSVKKSCEWLSTVVSTILDACKLNAGILELTPSPFCIRALMHECVEMAHPKLGGKQIVLFADVSTVGDPTESVMVNADAPRLRQVVLNLLFNAAKYTTAGYVELFVRYDPLGDTIIRVADTGPGIPRGERAHLFEQFTQAESVSTNVLRGGTGLGLYIAKAVLDLMGGDIVYRENHTAPSGSIFEVKVPLPPAASTDTAPLAIEKVRGPLVIAVGAIVAPLSAAYVKCASMIVPTARVVEYSTSDEYHALVARAAADGAYLLVLADDAWVGNQRFLEFSSSSQASVLHLSLLDHSLCDRHWGKRGPTIGCIDHHVDALALKLLVRAWLNDEKVQVATVPKSQAPPAKSPKKKKTSAAKKRNR